jgi:hypothetical protein
MPVAPTRENRNPARNRTDDPEQDVEDDAPSCLFTILVAIKPAIRPKMIQPIMDI